ncbi:cupredoxin domain-containing protein [Pseudaminobacter sp. 19-2017]|uniref:Cupredoxin domain-containing protein n=1 Tax=Pseudaminobacter soli (ex Zhang et al. 2022) TaxID=2831468 RepID=A0A942DYN1_9HYPH|nr:cupredoxin domain-containing protein [Pseudaminobacter soli]MBS3647340.1 cupredoxin domain-containing protein [Pseudaminobacter soli]
MSIEHRSLWLAVVLVLPLAIAQAAQAETIQVVIDKMAFSPTAISAKVGDTIEWINKDPVVHTATVKGEWEVMLPAKKSVTQRLEKKEAVDFYCRFHPNMKGKLTVD